MNDLSYPHPMANIILYLDTILMTLCDVFNFRLIRSSKLVGTCQSRFLSFYTPFSYHILLRNRNVHLRRRNLQTLQEIRPLNSYRNICSHKFQNTSIVAVQLNTSNLPFRSKKTARIFKSRYFRKGTTVPPLPTLGRYGDRKTSYPPIRVMGSHGSDSLDSLTGLTSKRDDLRLFKS